MAEKKHQEESNLQHHEPPACTKLLCAILHLESSRAPALPDTSCKPAWETFNIPTGDHQVSNSIPTASPGINQNSPLERQIPPPHKKIKKTITKN
jgi:hypothetical protein